MGLPPGANSGPRAGGLPLPAQNAQLQSPVPASPALTQGASSPVAIQQQALFGTPTKSPPSSRPGSLPQPPNSGGRLGSLYQSGVSSTPSNPKGAIAMALASHRMKDREHRDDQERSIREYWTRYGAPGDWTKGPNLSQNFYTEEYVAEYERHKQNAHLINHQTDPFQYVEDGRVYHSSMVRDSAPGWTNIEMSKQSAMYKSSALNHGQQPIIVKKDKVGASGDWKPPPISRKQYILQDLANAYRAQGVTLEMGEMIVQANAAEASESYVDLYVGATVPAFVRPGCVVNRDNVLIESA